MKKQTKLVAVLSTASLLAIGASMTSFAGLRKMELGFTITATASAPPTSGRNPATAGTILTTTARWQSIS